MADVRLVEVDITGRGDGDIPSWDTAAGKHLYVAPSGVPTGTAMPGSPANNDLIYRTDLDLLFFYDGTRWLTTTLYTDPIPPAAVHPVSASGGVNRVALPLAGLMSVWAENFWLTFHVAGGTALSGSHHWLCSLTSSPSGTTVASYDINSGASSAWRNSGAVSMAAVIATTEFGLDLTATKTGTPGTLYSSPRISYRLIGT